MTLCNIVSVGRRRDGGTRYWCIEHRGDATAKYGRPSIKCRFADEPDLSPDEILHIDIANYPGGIALWGAVPAVYDTTSLPLDRGIHVHAREARGGDKLIDRSFRQVNLSDSSRNLASVAIAELDAIYYMVSSIFGFPMTSVDCITCGYPHLDKDWFSLHAHQRHLCAGCGKYFKDSKVGIGNPLIGVQEYFGLQQQALRPAKKKLRIKQSEYPGGIQIWGSNQSFFWTGHRNEEEGIHVHVFDTDGETMLFDDTFGEVTIDGVTLDPTAIRYLMAQNILPHLQGRVISITCASCNCEHFSEGVAAFTPQIDIRCNRCDAILRGSTRYRRIISNPAVAELNNLGSGYPRQFQTLNLFPETL